MKSVGLQAKTCTLCQQSYHPPEKDSKFCKACHKVINSYADIAASTKIIKMLELIKQMRKEDPDRKALIFSQFTSFFDILRPFLTRANIKFVVCKSSTLYFSTRLTDGTKADECARPVYRSRQHGQVRSYNQKLVYCFRHSDSVCTTRKQREESLNTIKEDPTVHVILVSLKAGAQGLNLTCCSTVFIADLWWNPAIEVGTVRCGPSKRRCWSVALMMLPNNQNQAIDRAHRMGQEKEVKVYKFVITDTVEERILTLQ